MKYVEYDPDLDRSLVFQAKAYNYVVARVAWLNFALKVGVSLAVMVVASIMAVQLQFVEALLPYAVMFAALTLVMAIDWAAFCLMTMSKSLKAAMDFYLANPAALWVVDTPPLEFLPEASFRELLNEKYGRRLLLYHIIDWRSLHYASIVEPLLRLAVADQRRLLSYTVNKRKLWLHIVPAVIATGVLVILLRAPVR